MDTGLPALPKGYFWRIAIEGTHKPELQIRKKRLFGSDMDHWAFFFDFDVNDINAYVRDSLRREHSAIGDVRKISPEIIRFNADAVLVEFTENKNRDRMRDALLGNYPPKSIA